MNDYQPAERSFPTPATQRRTGEVWKARIGLGFVIALTLVSGAVLFRLAGLGVAAAVSPFQAAPTSTPIGRMPTTAGLLTSTVLPATNVAGTPRGQTPVPTQPAMPTPVAPGQSTSSQLVGASPTRPPAIPTATTAVTVGREHVVASGDTLGAIAAKYGTSVDTLVRLNDFKDKNQILSIGQKVKVP
jgi:LysM repeat protein